MTSKATTPEQYLKELPADRKEAVKKLRDTVVKNLPKGFKEVMGYGMLGYVPYKLIGDLIKKMSVKDWINVYETNFKAARKK